MGTLVVLAFGAQGERQGSGLGFFCFFAPKKHDIKRFHTQERELERVRNCKG